MRLDRLIGILTLLTRREKMTAPELAEYFEVSRRTINRDIESLCMAGIPIVTRQGNSGGISIQEGYKPNNSLYKQDEIVDIITGLSAIDSISASADLKLLINKVLSNKDIDDAQKIVRIDLSSFYRESISSKVEMIKKAVADSSVVTFTYYSRDGQSQKRVEPYNILYKWENWYLYAYSYDREELHLYKLNRIWDIQILEARYQKRQTAPEVYDDLESVFPDNYELKATFDSGVQYILVETYGDQSFQQTEDGSLYFIRSFTNFDYMLTWILGFGDRVIVHEPDILVNEIKRVANSIINKY